MKNIFLIILLIISNTGLKAQSNIGHDLNETVDYVTYVCINSTLSKNEKVTNENKQITINDIPQSYTSTIDLFNEFQKLKKQSNIKDYSHFFSEEIFSDQKRFGKIYAFADKRKGEEIVRLKTEILNYIEDKENVSDQEVITSDTVGSDSMTSENIVKGTETASDDTNDFGSQNRRSKNSSFFDLKFWVILIGVFILIIMIALFFLTKKIFKIEDSLNHLKKVSKESKSNTNQIDFNINYNKLDDEIRKLKSQIRDLSPVQDYNNNSVKSDIPEIKNHIELEVTPKKLQEVFYMATPDDMFFDMRSISSIPRPTQTLYKFTADNMDKSKATFVFDSDEIGISEAVNAPHRYLDSVCESQNAHNQNAKKITTTKPGIAEKRNDRWVVITKAKIKYE